MIKNYYEIPKFLKPSKSEAVLLPKPKQRYIIKKTPLKEMSAEEIEVVRRNTS